MKHQLSSGRKWLLLFFFSAAQFIDVCNISELFSAIPTISAHLGMSESQSVWLISGYQLTFSSFLLMGGRMSDVYNPKYVFTFGFGALGIFSIGAGFVNEKIGLITLRAITGVFAAFTIPSALSLIVHIFPEPAEQGKAIAAFGGAGSFGSMFGLVIGGIFTQLVSWRWVFFFNAFISIPISIMSFVLVPNVRETPERAIHEDTRTNRGSKTMQMVRQWTWQLKELDIPGIAILTVAIILFIFAVTSGSTTSWGTVRVIVPLITAVILLVVFFIYEARIPPHRAALPPLVWWYSNFAVFFALALFPYLWLTGVFLLFTTLFQDVYRWNPLITAVHFLPIGITAVFTLALNIGYLQKKLSYRMNVLLGFVFIIPASVLLTFANSRERYWSYIFPGFIIGSIGIVQIFLTSSIAIIACAPHSQSGIVGAVFNAALQLGAAVGSAAITSIQQNVDDKQPDPTTSFKGRQAGFWFLVAVTFVELIAFVIFYRRPPSKVEGTDTLVGEEESSNEPKCAGEKDLENQANLEREAENSSSRHSLSSSTHSSPASETPTVRASTSAV